MSGDPLDPFAGETFELVTDDQRHFFARFDNGCLRLNTKSNFKGRNARIEAAELATMVFDKARSQGAIHQPFGEAREVRPRSPAKVTGAIFVKRDKPTAVNGE